MRPSLTRSVRLALEAMEDRVVPAFNLVIDGDVANSSNVSIGTTFPGVTIFSPNAAPAILDVDDIETALAAGDVTITTGTGGSQAGNITWARNSIDDDLDYSDSTLRNLSIRPDGSSTVGNFTANLVSFNFTDNVDLFIDTTAPATDASIFLSNDTRISFAHNVNLLAGTGAVTLNSLSADPMVESGNFTVTAANFQNTEATYVVQSDL